VHATFAGVPGRGTQLWAAVLSAGPGAALSHETAAELHRLIDSPAKLIHVTVPFQRRAMAAAGISLHRSRRAVAAVPESGFPPRTTVPETVLDLTQTALTFDDVCGWVTRAFARRLTDETGLREAITAAAAMAC
jgi:predicted transcriptional regulator of viral defense system